MYAGALPVNATKDPHNLFYWFFKNTSLPAPAPLLLWLNGGPGSTSMFGLFLENGPLRVTKTGAGLDNFSLGTAPEGSWGEFADIIFLDQPAGTGFSYFDKQPLTSMEDGAEEMLQFLIKFITKYPEYNRAKFIIAGESYAGKYIPSLAKKILLYHAEQLKRPTNDQVLIDLQTLLIGDPFTSPVIQRTVRHRFTKEVGIID